MWIIVNQRPVVLCCFETLRLFKVSRCCRGTHRAPAGTVHSTTWPWSLDTRYGPRVASRRLDVAWRRLLIHVYPVAPRTGRVLLALQDGDVLVYATTRGKSKAGCLFQHAKSARHIRISFEAIKCLIFLTRYIRSRGFFIFGSVCTEGKCPECIRLHSSSKVTDTWRPRENRKQSD
jgi:hypothetical protein